MANMGLKNKKHELFCREYIVDHNATQAYKRAGYTGKGAEVSACKLLRNPNVSARVAELSAEACEKADISASRVLKEISEIAYYELEPSPLSVIRAPDKLKALDMLGKHLKLFTERHEIDTTERIDFSGWTDAQIDEFIAKVKI